MSASLSAFCADVYQPGLIYRASSSSSLPNNPPPKHHPFNPRSNSCQPKPELEQIRQIILSGLSPGITLLLIIGVVFPEDTLEFMEREVSEKRKQQACNGLDDKSIKGD